MNMLEHNQKIKYREYTIPSNITFSEYTVKWEEIYKASGAGNTRAIYQYVIRKYFACLEGVNLADISRTHYHIVLNEKPNPPAMLGGME